MKLNYILAPFIAHNHFPKQTTSVSLVHSKFIEFLSYFIDYPFNYNVSFHFTSCIGTKQNEKFNRRETKLQPLKLKQNYPINFTTELTITTTTGAESNRTSIQHKGILRTQSVCICICI